MGFEGGSEARPPEALQPGLLVAEPYSWKSLVTGQPVLKLRTTGTRAAVLSLPEGLVSTHQTYTVKGAYIHMLCYINSECVNKDNLSS